MGFIFFFPALCETHRAGKKKEWDIHESVTMTSDTVAEPQKQGASMPTTSRALLTEIIDYAGLFPPAKLPMTAAFTRFLAHRASDDGWLLARFVCPASRLGELTPLIAEADLGQIPVRIAALGAGGDDPPGYADAIEHDAEAMRAFGDRHAGTAVIDVFEVKLPGEGDPSEVVDVTFHHLADVATRTPVAYFEIPLLGDRPAPIFVAIAVAAAGDQIDETRRAGLKIRCGGLDASAVPGVDAVAAAITASLAAGLPLKATQGLHHPIRHLDSTLGTTVHGFLNLFAASVLARAHLLDGEIIREIIAEEDPKAFRLTESTLGWRDLETGFEGVVEGRIHSITSFGSCSFTEPRDDLAGLGWL